MEAAANVAPAPTICLRDIEELVLRAIGFSIRCVRSTGEAHERFKRRRENDGGFPQRGQEQFAFWRVDQHDFRRLSAPSSVRASTDVAKKELEATLPYYHFDLVNTKTMTDEGGADLHDDIEAMDSADSLARRILDERPDLKHRHYVILVTNDEGDEVLRLPLEVIH